MFTSSASWGLYKHTDLAAAGPSCRIGWDRTIFGHSRIDWEKRVLIVTGQRRAVRLGPTRPHQAPSRAFSLLATSTLPPTMADMKAYLAAKCVYPGSTLAPRSHSYPPRLHEQLHVRRQGRRNPRPLEQQRGRIRQAQEEEAQGRRVAVCRAAGHRGRRRGRRGRARDCG